MKRVTLAIGRTTVDVTSRPLSVEITATTQVHAPMSEVWATLLDTDSYPQWNPFVRRLDGELYLGARIEVVLQPGDKPQTMRPRIVDLDPGRSFTWLGHVAVAGILDGRHRFALQESSPGSVTLIQHERLTGALVPIFSTMLTQQTPRAFAALNDALARRVEPTTDLPNPERPTFAPAP